MVSLQYYERLNGKKFQVPGNHDHNGPWNKSAPHWWPIYAKFFTILPYITQVKLGEHRVDLCHFPHTGDHTEEERFLQWRPKDSGRWLLHGHSHGALGSVRPATREIDVGVDCWDLDTCA
jgi:calcineurin-like phosphoesterase family protein